MLLTSRLSIAISLISAMVLCDFTVVQAAGPSGRQLERILTGRNDVSRLRAVSVIDQQFASRLEATPHLAISLTRLAEKIKEDDREDTIQPGIAAMIATLSKVDRPEATKALAAALSTPSIAWTTITAEHIGQHKHHASIPALLKTFGNDLCSEHYGLRFAIVRSLLRMEHPDAYEALGRLQRSIDGQLQHKLDVELQKVTVEDFWSDQQRFDKWKSGEYLREAPKRVLSKDSMFKNASYSESLDRMKLTRQKYYNIDIYAKRLLFVIDRSGSMAQVGYRGTRLQKAKSELITAIRGLTEDTEFGIIVFDTHVRAYKDELQLATEENKRKAIKYVTALSTGKKTNTYSAMRKAIEFDDQLEAIFVLTDGQPTTGPIVIKEKILSDILARNDIRNITINTIAIGVDISMQGFLRGLAKPSGGEFRAVD